jgi:SAM-dependent methyltransferase
MGDLQAASYEQAVRSYARGRLLDLGCGNAPLAGLYRDFVDTYVWADWPNSMHQEFEVDLQVDLNRPLPISEAEYDTVLLSDVLEHIEEPDILFGEVARILRPGGVLIVGVPFLYWIHEEPHDHHRYTRYKLAAFGRKYGLEPVEISEVGGGIDTWIDLTGKMIGSVWRPLAAVFYHSWVAVRSFPFLAAMNAKSARRFPLAYVAVYRAERQETSNG